MKAWLRDASAWAIVWLVVFGVIVPLAALGWAVEGIEKGWRRIRRKAK